jgi:hypothetical protein
VPERLDTVDSAGTAGRQPGGEESRGGQQNWYCGEDHRIAGLDAKQETGEQACKTAGSDGADGHSKQRQSHAVKNHPVPHGAVSRSECQPDPDFMRPLLTE